MNLEKFSEEQDSELFLSFTSGDLRGRFGQLCHPSFAQNQPRFLGYAELLVTPAFVANDSESSRYPDEIFFENIQEALRFLETNGAIEIGKENLKSWKAYFGLVKKAELIQPENSNDHVQFIAYPELLTAILKLLMSSHIAEREEKQDYSSVYKCLNSHLLNGFAIALLPNKLGVVGDDGQSFENLKRHRSAEDLTQLFGGRDSKYLKKCKALARFQFLVFRTIRTRFGSSEYLELLALELGKRDLAFVLLPTNISYKFAPAIR